MNYEKAYKEALEKARMINNGEDVDVEAGTTTCEYIFPELKESKDESIRKWLICGMNALKEQKTETFATIPIDDAIAWLEEQGEPNPYSGTSFKYNGHTWGMCARDNGVEVMIDRKLVASIKPDGGVESMVQSYKKRLANEFNVSVESPLVKICLTSFRHGIENTIDELELNGLNKRPE